MTSVSAMNDNDEVISPIKEESIAPKRKTIKRKHVIKSVSVLLSIIAIVIFSLSLVFWIIPIATEEAAPTEDEFFDLFFGGIDEDEGTTNEVGSLNEGTTNEVGSLNEGTTNESNMNTTNTNGSDTEKSKTEENSKPTKPNMDMSVENIDKMMKEKKTNCVYKGEFSRDRKGSDFGHWGEGVICVTKTHVGFMGSLAWGPDYYLYYATEYVETRRDFYRIKSASFKGPRIKSFSGFIFELLPSIDVANYPALVVWCEAFGVYITSTRLTKT